MLDARLEWSQARRDTDGELSGSIIFLTSFLINNITQRTFELEIVMTSTVSF